MKGRFYGILTSSLDLTFFVSIVQFYMISLYRESVRIFIDSSYDILECKILKILHYLKFERIRILCNKYFMVWWHHCYFYYIPVKNVDIVNLLWADTTNSMFGYYYYKLYTHMMYYVCMLMVGWFCFLNVNVFLFFNQIKQQNTLT